MRLASLGGGGFATRTPAADGRWGIIHVVTELATLRTNEGLASLRRATLEDVPTIVEHGKVVATMQVSFLPGLARRGALRAQVEAVRVHADLRSSGLGRALLMWARGEAESRGCALMQLTSDKRRPDAHGFYEGLGFTASHEGFKLEL